MIPSPGHKNKTEQKKPVLVLKIDNHDLLLTGEDLQNDGKIEGLRRRVEGSPGVLRISLVPLLRAPHVERRRAFTFVDSLKRDCLFFGPKLLGDDLFGAVLTMVPPPDDLKAHEHAKLVAFEAMVRGPADSLEDKCAQMEARLRELGVENATHAELVRQARAIWKRGCVDIREALFNDGESGPAEQIQVSTERIVRVRGVLYDLDPYMYASGTLIPEVSHDASEFYENVTRTWLNRHPILSRCEVRATGSGLHGILWVQPPIDIESDADRHRWAGIIKVVQAALPIDPDQPGITGTTRALGSINSKNGDKVRRLVKGKPVTAEELLTLYNDMCSSPFKTLLNVLSGSDCVSPCPVCNGDGTKLSAMDYAGRCYGSCGTVKLETLYNTVLVPRKNA